MGLDDSYKNSTRLKATIVEQENFELLSEPVLKASTVL